MMLGDKIKAEDAERIGMIYKFLVMKVLKKNRIK